MVSDSQKEVIIDNLVTELSPHFIIVFGSYVKEQVHDASDLDLAYLSEKNYHPTIYSC